MARYLVTGGAGFIGSNLAEALVNKGHTVVVLDDFSNGKRENIAGFADRLTVIEGSITDLDVCHEAVSGVDYVLHQAALPSVPRSVADPVTTNAVNISGTLNMLVAARDAGVKRFVYAASSSAYGDAPVAVKTEDLPAAPLSPYAVQKHVGELYCQVFHRLYGLETVCLRYFNVFGPRQDPKSQYAAVVPLFVTAILRGESPTIYGDGEQARDFTYIYNVIHANLLACEAPAEAAGQIFNTACGAQTSVNELARLIMETLGCEVPVNYQPARAGDVKNSLADVSKAERLLGYRPMVEFREGLEQAIAWYKERELGAGRNMVVCVHPLEGFKLEMEFSTGETRVFDARPYLQKGIFQRLQDENLFRQAYVALDTVCWPGGLDIAPETLYDRSHPVV